MTQVALKHLRMLSLDEAHYTTDANKAPLAAQALQRLGYYVKDDYLEDILDTTGK